MHVADNLYKLSVEAVTPAAATTDLDALAIIGLLFVLLKKRNFKRRYCEKSCKAWLLKAERLPQLSMDGGKGVFETVTIQFIPLSQSPRN